MSPNSRQRIGKLVVDHSSKTGKKIPDVWNDLYKQFSYDENINIKKMAFQNDRSVIDEVEALEKLGDLEMCARKMFSPALPES